jgi:hypothetical protein
MVDFLNYEYNIHLWVSIMNNKFKFCILMLSQRDPKSCYINIEEIKVSKIWA